MAQTIKVIREIRDDDTRAAATTDKKHLREFLLKTPETGALKCNSI